MKYAELRRRNQMLQEENRKLLHRQQLLFDRHNALLQTEKVLDWHFVKAADGIPVQLMQEKMRREVAAALKLPVHLFQEVRFQRDDLSDKDCLRLKLSVLVVKL